VISTGQVAVGTASTFVCAIPPGACSYAFSNSGGTAVYVGAQSGAGTVAQTSSFVVPSGLMSPVFNCYPTSPGGTIKAIVAGGTGTLSYMISDSRGFPLPTPGTP